MVRNSNKVIDRSLSTTDLNNEVQLFVSTKDPEHVNQPIFAQRSANFRLSQFEKQLENHNPRRRPTKPLHPAKKSRNILTLSVERDSADPYESHNFTVQRFHRVPSQTSTLTIKGSLLKPPNETESPKLPKNLKFDAKNLTMKTFTILPRVTVKSRV